MTNKKWILSFLILILISVAALLLIRSCKSNGTIVTVRFNGEFVREIDLSLVDSSYSFTVGEENGKYNVISVTPEGVSVTEASCPDKVCIHHGILKNSFSPIVCLPNGLTITLEKESSVDALSK